MVEAEKIKSMLIAAGVKNAIIVNTCAVTAEAERQSRQAIRKLARESEYARTSVAKFEQLGGCAQAKPSEHPGVPLFITGCAATRAPEDYAKIPGVAAVVANKDKFNIDAYKCEVKSEIYNSTLNIQHSTLSKAFIQIQNGCNHSCAYCIVSKLRGKNVSFPYERILAETRAAALNGFTEVVLTGVDIAGYRADGGLGDLCRRLLDDIPQLQRLRLSSVDPASPECAKIIELMSRDPRMLAHLHLSMQSGSDKILSAMGRRHNAEIVRKIMTPPTSYLLPPTFSWDIICGFPGESPELFEETCALIKELKPIHIHAFPFSPRPGTLAATMPDQVDRAESKRRVKLVNELAQQNRREFMKSQIGKTTSVLMEEKNIGRTPDDIPVKVSGAPIPSRTVRDLKIVGADKEYLLA